MARTFGTGKYVQLSHHSSQTGLANLTLAAWFYWESDGGASDGRIVTKSKDSGGGDEIALIERGSQEYLGFTCNTTAANSKIDSSSRMSSNADTWIHGAGVLDGTDAIVYWNGTNEGSESNNGTTTGNSLDVSIGNHYQTPTVRFFSGRVAEVVLWSVALDPAELTELANGAPTLSFYPESIIFYLPVWGSHSPEVNIVGVGGHGTLTGSPAKADHPPLFGISRKKIFVIETAAAPGLSIPVAMHHYKNLARA